MAVADSSPIFIFSCARSGSTLLRFVLDTHPAIYAPPETALGNAANVLYYTFSALSGRQQPSHSYRKDPEVLANIRETLSWLMESGARRRGKPIWCEKTPTNIEHLEMLADLFPQARYICLYRNHLDTIQSLLATSRQGFPGFLVQYLLRSPTDFVTAIAHYWAEAAEKLVELEREHGASCHRIRYEELVGDTEETLAELFAFLRLDWSPELTRAVFRTPHDEGAGDPYIHFSGKIHTDSLGRGRSLSASSFPDELGARIAELNRELGYAELVEELAKTGTQSPREPAPVAQPPRAAGPNGGRQPVAAAAPVVPAGGGAGSSGPEAHAGPRWVFETHLPSRLAAHREKLAILETCYRFAISGEGGGNWRLERDRDRFQVVPEGPEPGAEVPTTIHLAAQDLLGIVEGRLNALRVLEEERISVSGEPPNDDQFILLVELVRADV